MPKTPAMPMKRRGRPKRDEMLRRYAKSKRMEPPKDLKYSEYVWVAVKGDIATLGMTDYGLKVAKDIVFIDLPKKGAKINRGGQFVSLESVKWSGHLASPVSGEVVEVNDALFDEPEKLNKNPYGSWICRVRMSKPDEAGGLMDSKAAAEWVKKNL